MRLRAEAEDPRMINESSLDSVGTLVQYLDSDWPLASEEHHISPDTHHVSSPEPSNSNRGTTERRSAEYILLVVGWADSTVDEGMTKAGG